MIAYASNTGTKRNLAELKKYEWRILLSPKNPKAPEGLRFAIDNGAWSCFRSKEPFDTEGFLALVDSHGGAADFVVIPDIVAGGFRSLEFSLGWLRHLSPCKKLLLAVQDGMRVQDVAPVLVKHNLGLFLGGTTEWKLKTLHDWGVVAAALGVYYHVGRVNTRRRIRLCAEAGADSFDGTSATLYSVNVRKLDSARNQPSLLSPRNHVTL